MSIEDALAKLDKAENPQNGAPRWVPPPEIAAKLLELHAAGLKAGALSAALEDTEYSACPTTVRTWLRQHASTP